METELLTRSAVYAVAVPVIIGLVQVAKLLGLPRRYAPLVALLLGIAISYGTVAALPEPPQHWFISLLIGVGLGLGASGLYSGVRATGAPPSPEDA